MRTEIVSCKDYVDIKKKELKEEIKHLYKKTSPCRNSD